MEDNGYTKSPAIIESKMCESIQYNKIRWKKKKTIYHNTQYSKDNFQMALIHIHKLSLSSL